MIAYAGEVIETRHLRVLREVGRSGSYSAAARALGISQPAVSQQMKALEQTAGTPLVVRSGRDTRLTEAGRALVRHATGILAGLTAAEEEVAALAGLRTGLVRLVSFPSGGAGIVPGALARMRAEHPGARVLLEEVESQRSVELLRTGECDVVLAYRGPGADGPGGPDEALAAGAAETGARVGHRAGGAGGPGGAERERLVETPLVTERFVGLVPSGHPLAPGRGAPGEPSGEPVPLAAFEGEPWIAGCPRCRRDLVDACREQGFVPRVDHVTDDPAVAVGLVGAGLGVALLPEPVVRSLRLREVGVVRVRPPVGRRIVALTLPDLARVPAVERLLRALVAAAADRRTDALTG